MAKLAVRVICWAQSHVTDLAMTALQAKKLDAAIHKLKRVCPHCKPANEAIVIASGPTILQPAKAYRCERGHLTTIAPLGEMLHVKFGPDPEQFVNVKTPLEELTNRVDSKDIACNHVADGKLCDCQLAPLDDFKLERPSIHNIKTRMLVGDLWDRHGIEPVRSGQYDKNGDYKESRSQKANVDRLNQMNRSRNTPATRQPGRAIKRPTKTDYGRRDKPTT